MDNDRCGHSQVNYILKNVGNEFYDSYIPIFIKDVDPITNKRLDISDYYKLNKEENSKKLLQTLLIDCHCSILKFNLITTYDINLLPSY